MAIAVTVGTTRPTIWHRGKRLSRKTMHDFKLFVSTRNLQTKGGGMYLVFPVIAIVIVTVIVL